MKRAFVQLNSGLFIGFDPKYASNLIGGANVIPEGVIGQSLENMRVVTNIIFNGTDVKASWQSHSITN